MISFGVWKIKIFSLNYISSMLWVTITLLTHKWFHLVHLRQKCKYVKKLNFCQKAKFESKIKICVKNQNFCQKSKFVSKIKLFVKYRNVCPKSNFLSKIKIFIKNRIFLLKIKILLQQSKLWSKNWNFSQNFGQKKSYFLMLWATIAC